MSDQRMILFVDDEPNVLAGLRRLLRGRMGGCELQCVTSAQEALGAMRSGPIDAVVADVQMAGMSGLELLETMRQDPDLRDIPVSILTGSGDRELKRRALDLGATDLLSKPVAAEDLIARIRNMLRLKGFADRLKDWNAHLEDEVRQRTVELERARLEIIWRLAKAGEFRDEETGAHVVRVGCYGRTLAETLGADRNFVESVYLTAPLHDIGKIGIPDGILHKPGRLSDLERKIMQRHCRMGAEILRREPLGLQRFLAWRGDHWGDLTRVEAVPVLETACQVALYHHERHDGSGYPEGLAGEQVPLAARITAIADVYDALTSARPYKPAFTHEESLAILNAEADEGKHDPRVYQAFRSVEDQFRYIRSEITETAPETAAAVEKVVPWQDPPEEEAAGETDTAAAMEKLL